MSVRLERVASADDVRNKLARGPAIFLSASVPYQRGPAAGVSVAQNQAYLDSAEPARVRSAVTALTRTMLLRDVRLVFGAHPAISPMVLETARDVALYRDERIGELEFGEPSGAPREAGPGKARVLIFQSQYFERALPNSTLDLASWDAGLLVFTPVVRVKGKPREAWRKPSLDLMRKLMVSVPDLRAAIFVGGMEGVVDEARLFREHNPGKPMYALASTGSASRDLWNDDPRSYSGTLGDAVALQDNPSYSVIAGDILGDLGIEEQP